MTRSKWKTYQSSSYALSDEWSFHGWAQAYNRTVARTWILTGSPENHEASRAHGFGVIGLKERNRGRALAIEPRDRIVLYATKVMAFVASIRVEGEMFENRTPLWPGKPGNADAYPWRFETAPEIVLEEPDWLPAETLVGDLEHIRKWPREHWKLAFQGQIRPVSDHDAEIVIARMSSRSRAAA